MRQLIAALALIALWTAAAGPANAQSCDEAKQFVAGVGRQVTDTVANPSLSTDQRLDRFKQIFKSHADFPTMAKVALGQWWKSLPANRHNEYFALVEQLIVRVMFGRLIEFAGERYSIETRTCAPKGTRGREFLVDGPVIRTGGGPVADVRWWVIKTRSGALKVLDVSIAGISLTLQKREEFDAFIRNNGNNVEALLSDLRRRVGA